MKKKLTTEDFITQAKQIHGNKYDYSKAEYKGALDKVCIICPEHGEFWQQPNHHLSGHGCCQCEFDKLRYDSNKFIEQAKAIHGDKYDYSKVDYKNSRTKVCIICKQCGTEFWQKPNNHVIQKQGCPECNNSKGEERIKLFLDKNNISYIHDKPCLKFLGSLRPDFYLPDYNMVIEYDGKQHFESISIWGGDKRLENIKELDNRKNQLCEENNVKLVRISYTQINKISNILSDVLLR